METKRRVSPKPGLRALEVGWGLKCIRCSWLLFRNIFIVFKLVKQKFKFALTSLQNEALDYVK